MQKEVTLCHLRAVQVFAWEDEDNHKNLSYDNARHPPRHMRVQVAVVLSSSQIARAKKKKNHELLITSINIVVTYRHTVTTRIDSLYFASVFGSPPPVTQHVRHKLCHNSVLAI